MPAEFEVSDYLLDDNNLLAIKVLRWCDGSYLEVYDYLAIYTRISIFVLYPVRIRFFPRLTVNYLIQILFDC